jgi:HK97 gp10 family phage protein
VKEFTLLGFIEHAALMAVEVIAAEHHALEKAAKIVEAEAKASVGTYQGQSGPFAAWDPLAEATKADRVAKSFPEDEPELRTGEMRDSIEHTVKNHEAEIGSNSEILEWQELGTAKMPPRSILGGAAARKEHQVVEVLGSEVVAVLAGTSVLQRIT